ncbi:MAG: hypothetical protein KKF62_09050 [Bacteroidetes bacterium]|nr:hypothetical protein [Bacteroidota bacterium]MBU1117138.1 hypothetical protein [Bacteroidota bacterium]MBU1796820.1 hypothetical protein [Bacteroidota bacterium]
MLQNGLIKIVITIIFITSTIFAQLDSTKANNGINIYFYNGYALSYKWNANQNMSHRVSLGLSSSIESSDNNSEEVHLINNYKNNFEQTNDIVRLDINASFQFLFNIVSQKSLNMYLGIGPSLNYFYNKSESERNSESDDNERTFTNTNKSYGVGIISIVGVEAYLTDSITLFAESHLIGRKYWSKREESYESNYIISQDGSGWSANLQLVKVGLGIYF